MSYHPKSDFVGNFFGCQQANQDKENIGAQNSVVLTPFGSKSCDGSNPVRQLRRRQGITTLQVRRSTPALMLGGSRSSIAISSPRGLSLTLPAPGSSTKTVSAIPKPKFGEETNRSGLSVAVENPSVSPSWIQRNVPLPPTIQCSTARKLDCVIVRSNSGSSRQSTAAPPLTSRLMVPGVDKTKMNETNKNEPMSPPPPQPPPNQLINQRIVTKSPTVGRQYSPMKSTKLFPTPIKYRSNPRSVNSPHPILKLHPSQRCKMSSKSGGIFF